MVAVTGLQVVPLPGVGVRVGVRVGSMGVIVPVDVLEGVQVGVKVSVGVLEGVQVEVGVRVGDAVAVAVGVGASVRVARIAPGAGVSVVPTDGTVALITKFWFGGQVTGTFAGMTMGPPQAANMAIKISAKKT